MNYKRRIKRNQILIYFVSVIFSCAYIYFGNQIASIGLNQKANSSGYYMESEVSKIIEKIPAQDAFSDTRGFHVRFRAMIISGKNKGIMVSGIKNFDVFAGSQGNIDIKEGDKILIYNDSMNSDKDWIFLSFIRTNYLIYFGAFFLVMLLVFGQLKGMNTIISLAFTVLSIFVVLVPAALSGQNIYIWSIITCLYITVMTLLFVGGANLKSLAAAIGCFGGVLISALLIFIMNQFIHLTGVVSEESVFLLNMSESNPIDLKAVVFGMIIIGAIGAIMDVAMSISSSLQELSIQIEHPTFGRLLKSGFTIGKDMMGTMTNTLILAYIGSSFALVLLLVADNTPLIYLFNREMIVVEILQSLVGSLGLLFAIPFTSLISAKLFTGKYHRFL